MRQLLAPTRDPQSKGTAYTYDGAVPISEGNPLVQLQHCQPPQAASLCDSEPIGTSISDFTHNFIFDWLPLMPSEPESSISTAFGAVVGYIGAEAATTSIFEGLLWPQRCFSRLNTWSAAIQAFLMPMGGPTHKAALKAFDIIFAHDLFQGSHRGHMLDTAFYPQLEWTYTMHGDEKAPSSTRPVRNGLWPRALRRMTLPQLDILPVKAAIATAENGSATAGPPVRARVTLSHLVLSRATAEDKKMSYPLVTEGVGFPTVTVLFGIIIAELSAVVIAVIIGFAYQSLWAFLWLAPLFLRLLSSVLSVDREPLLSAASASDEVKTYDFEIHCPQSEGKFMVITGPSTIVLQFFRHYGHPIRNRFRELVQFVIIAIFASFFPIGLICSAMWMPPMISSIWLYYQLYVVLAMHIARFSTSAMACTTEADIATKLSQGLACVDNGSGYESAILFGNNREGFGTIKASVVVTYHDRFGSGQKSMKDLLQVSIARHTDKDLPSSTSPKPILQN